MPRTTRPHGRALAPLAWTYLAVVLLAAWNADVVALQECTGALAERTRALPGWWHHDEWGLCLLSRRPILAVVGPDVGSDHRPLVVDLVFTGISRRH